MKRYAINRKELAVMVSNFNEDKKTRFASFLLTGVRAYEGWTFAVKYRDRTDICRVKLYNSGRLNMYLPGERFGVCLVKNEVVFLRKPHNERLATDLVWLALELNYEFATASVTMRQAARENEPYTLGPNPAPETTPKADLVIYERKPVKNPGVIINSPYTVQRMVEVRGRMNPVTGFRRKSYWRRQWVRADKLRP